MECLPSLFLFRKYKSFDSLVLAADNYTLNKKGFREFGWNSPYGLRHIQTSIENLFFYFRVIVSATAETFVEQLLYFWKRKSDVSRQRL